MTLLLLKGCVLFEALLYLSLQDIYFGLLPDRIVFPTAILGLLFAFFDGGIGVEDSLLGGTIGGGVLLFLRALSKKGMGLGDIKLGMALGVWLGIYGAAFALWSAYMMGGLWALCRLALGASRKDTIRFGPFLSIGAMLVFFFEDTILLWIWWWMH
ncbi:A24 family peptidase [Selenomonas sp. TAMA-11512]|uniref:prepilin peptidase n=1 Tax=Selenomonas sp. TAMA-11512 TaxID=3095337 RepID=UPI0030D2A75D